MKSKGKNPCARFPKQARIETSHNHRPNVDSPRFGHGLSRQVWSFMLARMFGQDLWACVRINNIGGVQFLFFQTNFLPLWSLRKCRWSPRTSEKKTHASGRECTPSAPLFCKLIWNPMVFQGSVFITNSPSGGSKAFVWGLL